MKNALFLTAASVAALSLAACNKPASTTATDTANSASNAASNTADAAGAAVNKAQDATGAAVGARAAHALAIEQHLAGGGRVEPCHDAQQRRFAAA